jgi:hypothetical protein
MTAVTDLEKLTLLSKVIFTQIEKTIGIKNSMATTPNKPASTALAVDGCLVLDGACWDLIFSISLYYSGKFKMQFIKHKVIQANLALVYNKPYEGARKNCC